MAKIRIPFADNAHNRSYLNTEDYLLLNAFMEKNGNGMDIVSRPGWKKKLTVSSLVSSGRGFIYSNSHSLYYAVIGDALFSIDPPLLTVTELVRKTPISAAWSAAAGGTLTYVFAAAHGFVVTQNIKPSGITGATISDGYIGVKTIAAVTTTTVANDTFTITGVGANPGAATLTNARVSPILTDTGKIYFEQTKNSTATVTMLQIPKTSSYSSQLFMIASGGTVTRITDADLPTDCIGSPVSIDSYLFVLSAAASNINNSDLETPASYNSLGFVTADAYADAPVSLGKHHNQLVCFKDYSTEFFYDAAIASPASPIAKIPQQTLQIGCASAASITYVGNNMIWLSRNQNGGLAVHMLMNGTQQKVSTAFIDRILASMESFVFGDKVESFFLSFEGHDFYGLTIEGTVGTNQAIAGIAVAGIAVAGVGTGLSTYKRTLVYDITENQWAEWSTYDATASQQASFFATYAISGPHVTNNIDYTNALIMEKATGDIYEMSPPPVNSSYGASYQDGTRAITVKAVTNNLDGGTRNRKRMKSLEIIGDRSSVSDTVSVRYSDDDYQNWSTYRTIDLSTRARLFNLGSFQRRAFEFSHTSDKRLRMNSFEIDVEQMEH